VVEIGKRGCKLHCDGVFGYEEIYGMTFAPVPIRYQPENAAISKRKDIVLGSGCSTRPLVLSCSSLSLLRVGIYILLPSAPDHIISIHFLPTGIGASVLLP